MIAGASPLSAIYIAGLVLSIVGLISSMLFWLFNIRKSKTNLDGELSQDEATAVVDFFRFEAGDKRAKLLIESLGPDLNKPLGDCLANPNKTRDLLAKIENLQTQEERS